MPAIVSRRVAVACLALAANLTLRAAEQAPTSSSSAATTRDQSGSALIVGRVVDEAGKPLEGVRVTRWIAGGANQQFEVITDGEGRFLFRNVRAGDYTVVAESSNYRAGQYGRRRPEGPGLPLKVRDGEIVADVTITMFGSQSGIVTGTITDEAGEPVAGAIVRAVQRRSTSTGDGRSPYVMSPYSASTDDRGVYRLALPAGEVAIVVVPAPVSTLMESANRVPPVAIRDNTTANAAGLANGPPILLGDARVYLSATSQPGVIPYITAAANGISSTYRVATMPGLSEADSTGLLRIDPGSERSGIDVRLERVAALRVTGRVVGPDGPVGNLSIRLVPWFVNPPGQATFDVATTITRPDGAFTLAGVPPGSYILRAADRVRTTPVRTATTAVDTGPGTVVLAGAPASAPAQVDGTLLWTELPLQVGHSDLADVIVQLVRGAAIRGRIVFDASTSLPPLPATSRISLFVSGTNAIGLPVSTTMQPDGRFVVPELPPGRYNISASAPSTAWVMASAMLGGQDVSTSGFDLGNSTLDGLVITLTNKTTTLMGAVRTARGPDPDATVCVFPAGYGTFGGYGSPDQRFKQARVGLDGTYAVTGLPAGDYLVVAIDDAGAGNWRTEAMLAKLARVATRVSVTDSGGGRAPDLLRQVMR